jgi:hypothetical protein
MWNNDCSRKVNLTFREMFHTLFVFHSNDILTEGVELMRVFELSF